jgi:hypothetical protein
MPMSKYSKKNSEYQSNKGVTLTLNTGAFTGELNDEEAIPVALETAEELALTTNIYAEIRKRLALRGVPVNQVAFIHDVKTPEARAKLFAAVNKGEVRVLIGSTEKMGTGMNVQERCIAMHTITPPWRPGDIEQQVGRILRQGNLFPQVFQFVHITEGSFDGYTWGLLENKAGFIDQIARGEVNAREVEDVSDTVLTFSEIKAIASGNPLIMQKVVLEAEYQRLSAVRASWQSSNNRLLGDVRAFEHRKTFIKDDIARLQEAAHLRDANTPEKFSIQLVSSIMVGSVPTINDNTLKVERDREVAGKKIMSLARQAALKVTGVIRTQSVLVIGKYRGFDIYATASMLDDQSQPIPYLYFMIGNERQQITADTEAGVTRSMDLRLKGIEALIANKEAGLSKCDVDIQAAILEVERPWEHEQQFKELEAKIHELNEILNKDKKTDSQELLTPLPQHSKNKNECQQKHQNNTGVELSNAISAIRAMMSNPTIVSRFAGAADILTPTGLEELGKEIETKQALFDLGTTLVQLDLFGGSVSAEELSNKKNRRR